MQRLLQWRNRLKISQRRLAVLAGVSFRTVQLIESGQHDSKTSTLGRVAHALGYPQRAVQQSLQQLFATPPDSVAVCSTHMSMRNWHVPLFNFVDAFRGDHDMQRVAAPPVEQCPAALRSLLAAVVEALCAEHGVAAPWWTRAIPALNKPWFVAKVENLKAMSLVECPVWFRKRNIFVLANFLERA